MSNFGQRMTVTFSAGCLGGLINSLALWLIGQAGITAEFGVKLAPSLSPEWLYPRIVWGGIWGFLFLLPLLRSDTLLQGLLLSLGPTIVATLPRLSQVRERDAWLALGNVDSGFCALLQRHLGSDRGYMDQVCRKRLTGC